MIRHVFVTPIPDTNGGAIPAGAIDIADPREFGIEEPEGLFRPEGDDHLVELGGIDASYYAGTNLKAREMTFNITAQSDMQRMRLYKALPFGAQRRFWIETGAGTFWIDGYAMSIPGVVEQTPWSDHKVKIKCPYPWFRSLHPNIFDVPILSIDGDGGTADYASLSQHGDVAAGVELFVGYKSDKRPYPESSYPGAAFTMQDLSLNVFKFNYTHDDTVAIKYESKPVMLINTTPGNFDWAKLEKRSSSGTHILKKYIPSSITLSGDNIMVPPDEGNSIGFYFDYHMDYSQYFRAYAQVFDTWSGI